MVVVSTGEARLRIVEGQQLTIWWRRLAAPRPVGPMPMTRTSTCLAERHRQHLFPASSRVVGCDSGQIVGGLAAGAGEETVREATYWSALIVMVGECDDAQRLLECSKKRKRSWT